MNRYLSSLIGAVALLVLTQGPTSAGPFTPGGLVVVRVGAGINALNSATTAVFLDEYHTTGGAVVQSLALPTATSGTNRALTLGGVATTEGYLTRSVDGQYLSLAGYDANPGATAGTSTPTAFGGNTDRVIARVDAYGGILTNTVLTNAYSGDSVRSVT